MSVQKFERFCFEIKSCLLIKPVYMILIQKYSINNYIVLQFFVNVYDKQSYQAMIFITKLKHLLSLLITLLRASLLNKSINFFFLSYIPLYTVHILNNLQL